MENDGALANLSTLYNERTKLRKDKLHGRTPIQALFDASKASNFTHFHRCDDDGAITFLFSLTKNLFGLLADTIMSCLWTAHTRQTSTDSPYFTLLVWKASIANFRLASPFFKKRSKTITCGHNQNCRHPDTKDTPSRDCDGPWNVADGSYR